jgi:glycosyltransferase involved in cell wall biosynthesis
MRNEFDPRPALFFRRLIQSERYDIVHFHTKRAHALALWLGRSRRMKTVVTRRMDYPLKKNWYNLQLYNRRTDAVVAISRRIAEVLMEAGVHERKIRVIYSGIDPESFAPFSFRPWCARPVVVGTVALLVKRKGHRFLLQAAAILKKRGYQLRYRLVGDGPERENLEQLVATLGLEEEVSFQGFLSNVPLFLPEVDIFVLPSLYEGLGVAVLEAMAAGKPIVGCQVGGIPELIRDRENGLLVPPGNAEALADAITLLLSRQGLAESLARRAWEKVRSEFTLEQMGKKNESLYYELLQHDKA